MSGIECRIHPIVIQQCVHARNPRRCYFNIKEEIVWNCDSVNEEIIHCHLIGHIAITCVCIIHSCDIDEEKIDEEVMEIQECCKDVILKRGLYP